MCKCTSEGAPTGPRKARPDDRLRASPESITTTGIMDSGPAPYGASRNDGGIICSPLPGQPKRSFHHLHTSPADMRGHDNAVRFADAGQQQARPVDIDALPDAQLQFAIPFARQVGE